MAKCRVQVSSGGQTRTIEVDKNPFTIGRGDNADVKVHSSGISRAHLSVTIKDGSIWVKDLGSSNGSKLGGQKLDANEEVRYSEGKKLTLGLGNDTVQLAIPMPETELPPLPILKDTQPAVGEEVRFDNDAEVAKPDPVVSIRPVSVSMSAPAPQPTVPSAPAHPHPTSQAQDPKPQFQATTQSIPEPIAPKPQPVEGTLVDHDFIKKTRSQIVQMDAQVLEEAKAAALKIKIQAEAEIVQMKQVAKERALAEVAQAKDKAEDIISEATERAFKIKRQGEEELSLMRQALQENLNKVQTEFDQKAEIIRKEARDKGESIITDYQARAEKLLSDARLQATVFKSEAQKESDHIVSQAYQKALEIKTAAEVTIKDFQKAEKDKAAQFVTQAQAEADRTLNEARAASSIIRKNMEKEVESIKINAEKEAADILEDAREESEKQRGQIVLEAQRSSEDLISRTREQLEKEKIDVLNAAEEEGQKLRSDAVKLAKKEAANFLKAAELERSELLKTLDALKQETTLQEKRKGELSQNLKTLQKKTVEIQTEYDQIASKVHAAASEVAKQEELLIHKRHEFESVIQESKKAQEIIKTAQTSQKDLETARAALASEIENLKKQKTKLEGGLQAYMQQTEQDKQRQRGHVEKEVLSFKEQSLAEIKALKEKAMAEFTERKAQQEAELAKMRKTELETIKGMRAQEQALFEDSKRHKILEISKALETYIVPRVKESMGWKDLPKAFDNIFNELKEIVGRVIEGEFSQAAAQTAMDVMTPPLPKAKKGKRNVFIVVGAGLASVAAIMFVPFSNDGQRKPASEVFLERLREKEAKKPKFTPKITEEYKASYTDNVIYTKDYVNFKLDPDIQANWIKDLNKFFMTDLGLNENVIVNFISTETSLVTQLKDLRAIIHVENEKGDIQKMVDLEKNSVAEMSQLLGGPEKYRSFRNFERDYFTKNRKPASNP